MFDNLFTLPTFLPLGAILFNFLFLLAAIPIEAVIFHRNLKFDKKTSAYYSISLNLFSSVIGWFFFFIAEPFLPKDLKTELISYVFFNTINNQAYGFAILIGCIIFFLTFLLKFLLLKYVMLNTLNEKFFKDEEESQQPLRQSWRRASRTRLLNTNLVATMLIGNAMSYGFIALILLVRSK
jgi:hypothetical protein